MIYKAQFETKRSRVDFDSDKSVRGIKVYQTISSHARQERRG